VKLAPFLERHFFVTCLLLITIACLRIISTYSALSLTSDEPIHFACGLQYLANHIYTFEPQHPPLSRGLQALGPYLAGARPLGLQNKTDEGNELIDRSGNVDRTIFLMRMGNLPFFVMACLVVCFWSLHAFGKPVAVLATGLFTLLPTMLADGGLATTDMALGAAVGAAFVSAIVWAEKPTWWRTVFLGFTTALACLSKFTALGFLPVALFLALMSFWCLHWPGFSGLWESAKRRVLMIALAAVVALFVIWAGYWFSIGTEKLPHTQHHMRVPAPEFLEGIRAALSHNRSGHPAFLLGESRESGWWYYFPVALSVKTPIAFLVLVALGIFVSLAQRARHAFLLPLAFILGILLPAMRSQIDIGIRHIEPIYIGLSVIAALGLKQLLQWSRTGIAAALSSGILAMWMFVSGAIHHPDYLAYFNEFAGTNPEAILVDSNYDWGQDYKFLSKRLHELGVTEFSLASSWGEKLHSYLHAWYHLPAIKDADDFVSSPGWTVVSPTYDKSTRSTRHGSDTRAFWYDKVRPTERVGVFLLYYTASKPAALQSRSQDRKKLTLTLQRLPNPQTRPLFLPSRTDNRALGVFHWTLLSTRHSRFASRRTRSVGRNFSSRDRMLR
jgi:hypothetical protein